MSAHPSIVMIAKRRSGKSVVTKNIMYHYKKVPCGLVISPTDLLSSFYKDFFPDLYIHYNISEALLQKILKRQMLMINKSENKAKQGKKVNPACVMIMDDCLADAKQWKNMGSIKVILMNGRHYHLMYILTMQTPLGIGPDLRLNFDYIFLLREDTAINRKKLYNNYASMFDSLKDFETVFSKCTENFKCMVIANSKAAGAGLSEKVFWYYAESNEFSFGSKKFINYHKKYYDPKSIKRIRQADMLGATAKKKNVDVNLL